MLQKNIWIFPPKWKAPEISFEFLWKSMLWWVLSMVEVPISFAHSLCVNTYSQQLWGMYVQQMDLHFDDVCGPCNNYNLIFLSYIRRSLTICFQFLIHYIPIFAMIGSITVTKKDDWIGPSSAKEIDYILCTLWQNFESC